jgi:putative selenium metabolism hydrolase
MENYGKIVRAAMELREETVRILRTLVRFPCRSCGEEELIGSIRDEMAAAGIDEIWTDAMGNLVGKMGTGPVSIAFDAHVDVVGVTDEPLWTHPPYEGRVADGRFFGRGACDQKGAIASLLAAARLIRRFSLDRGATIYLVMSVQEEDCEGLAWCHLIEREGLKPDAVVITEPSGLCISRGQKGKIQLLVETTGTTSHGSAPHLGENAIYRMAPVIGEIEALDRSLVGTAPFGKGTVVISAVESDAPSLCSVAERCRIFLDRRLSGDENAGTAMRQIEALAAPHGGKVRVLLYEQKSYTGYPCRREAYYPGWLTPEGAPLFQAAQAAYENLFNSKARAIVWDFSTNGVATCGVHGIPTIGFGPGDPEMAHRRDECIPVDHLPHAAAFYAVLPSFVVNSVA